MDEVGFVTMVATLGGQPQVITLALDGLLARGVTVAELIVVHLADPAGRTKRALTRLAAEFADDTYQGRPLRYRLYPIRLGLETLPDVYSETDATLCWQGVNQLLYGLKARQRTLHICISGGRRMLGLLTLSAAAIHFGHGDMLWHIYTPDDLRQQANEGAIMHLPPDSGFRLIQVPMMPWASYFPDLGEGTRPGTPTHDVLAGPRAVLDEERRKECAKVMGELTKRERETLRYIAQGLTPQEAADKMEISLKTVDTYKTNIFSECRNVWGELGPGRVDYRWLADQFAPYFNQHTTKPSPWDQR